MHFSIGVFYNNSHAIVLLKQYIGSGNNLMPSSSKPLPDLMAKLFFTKICYVDSIANYISFVNDVKRANHMFIEASIYFYCATCHCFVIDLIQWLLIMEWLRMYAYVNWVIPAR